MCIGELDAGDPRERLIEEFARYEREHGPEAAADAANAVARLQDEFSSDELQRAALHRLRELEGPDE